MPKPALTPYDLPGLPTVATILDEALRTAERRLASSGSKPKPFLEQTIGEVALIRSLLTSDAQIARCELTLAKLIEIQKEEKYLDRFWSDFIAIPDVARYLELRYVKVNTAGGLTATNHTAKDAIHVCYVAFNAVFDLYQTHQRQRKGSANTLSIGDLRREMEREPYWIPGMHRLRMNGIKMACWVIHLIHFPRSEDLLALKTRPS